MEFNNYLKIKSDLIKTKEKNETIIKINNLSLKKEMINFIWNKSLNMIIGGKPSSKREGEITSLGDRDNC